MKNRAAETGPAALTLVAIEQGFAPDERIVTDDLACRFLPLGSRAWVRVLRPMRRTLIDITERKVPGLWGGIMARKRYIDEVVAATSAETVVNLGAGFDTRAYRIPKLTHVPVWEVDLPANIDAKTARLQKIFGEIPPHVRLVPIDFDRENLASTLASRGCPAHSITFFIWEGVTQYLTEEGARATLKFLGEAPPGSQLVFTYTPKDFIDGENRYGQDHLYRKMVGRTPIWHFGIAPTEVEALLGEFGWRTVEHLGYDELHRRYVQPTGRHLAWMAIERIVLAQREDAPS